MPLPLDDTPAELGTGSAFFNVLVISKHSEPFLPKELRLGINKIGIHIFRQDTKEYLETIKFSDVEKFGHGDPDGNVVFLVDIENENYKEFYHFRTKQDQDFVRAVQLYISKWKRV